MHHHKTHLTQIARLLSARTPLTYAQALQQARLASRDGLLPAHLDTAGIELAAQRLAQQEFTTTQPAAPASGGPLAFDAQGNEVNLSVRELGSHCALIGLTPDQRTHVLRALTDQAVQHGRDAVLLSHRVSDSSSGPRWLPPNALRPGSAGQHQATTAGAGDAHPRVTYTLVGDTAAGLAVGSTMALDQVRANLPLYRTTTSELGPLIIVDGAGSADGGRLLDLLARARAYAVAVVFTLDKPSQWHHDGGLAYALRNVNVVLARHPRDVAEQVRLEQVITPDAAPLLSASGAGELLLGVEKPVARQQLVRVAPAVAPSKTA